MSARNLNNNVEAVFSYTDEKGPNPYSKALLSAKISLLITEVGGTTKTLENLLKKLVGMVEGRCIVNGYVKPNSVAIINYSAGKVSGEFIVYTLVYECAVCNPVENDDIVATVKTITKAGIHAQVIDMDGNMPITVFIAREHHHGDQQFNAVKEGSRIFAKNIGTRFELNDPYVCVIASLDAQVSHASASASAYSKPLISLSDENDV